LWAIVVLDTPRENEYFTFEGYFLVNKFKRVEEKSTQYQDARDA
jgi:hypothetical protein